MTKQDKNMKEDEGKEERKEGRKDDEGKKKRWRKKGR
jgi:hypothetical protein